MTFKLLIGLTTIVVLNFTTIATADVRDDNFSKFLKKSLENFRDHMNTTVPELGIPVLDPYSLPVAELKENKGPLKVLLQLRNTIVRGLSRFTIQHIDASAQSLEASIGIRVSSIQIEGLYALDGVIYSIFPVDGNGSYWIDGSEILVNAEVAFEITQNLTLQATNLSMQFKVGEVQVNFQNILGGGDLGDLVNSMLNMFGKRILNTYLPDLLDEAILAFKERINEELKTFPLE